MIMPGITLDGRLKAELTGLLTEELQLSETLLHSLRREKDCLQQYDHNGFAQMAQQHENAVLALRELDSKRQTLFRQLQGADLNLSTLTFEHWQERLLTDPGLGSIVRKLRVVVADCASENQALGRLINMQTRFFDFLLKQLMPERNNSLTYSRSGAAERTGVLRSLHAV